jgi:hypothetical protein
MSDMRNETNTRMPAGMLAAIAVLAVVALLVFVGSARTTARRFLSSLRIEKPQAVAAAVPGASGSGGARQLQNMIGGMIARNVNVTLDEADQPAATADAASKLAGFAVRLPRVQQSAKQGVRAITVLGAHAIDMTADIAQLRTIFVEAGKKDLVVPASIDGSKLALHSPRAVRVQYGNCPAPAASTIQGQINGPPPPSTDNASCIVLTETPPVTAELPSGLDMGPMIGIALELSGMSPVESQALPRVLDWKSTLAVSLPRNLRSFEMPEVNGAPAMLLITAGRRGPAWELVWTDHGMVYTLAGYGNAADAVPLAQSVS